MTTLTLYGHAITRIGLAYQGATLYANAPVNESGALQSALYEWTIGGKTVSTGLTNAYVLTQDDVGKQVSVTAIALDSQGRNTIKIPGANVLTVVNVNDQPRGTVRIEGDARTAGTTLQAVSSITDADGMGTLGYQWKADGQPIAGATGASLTLTEATAGKAITIVSSYVDGYGHAESVASDADPGEPHPNHAGTTSIAGEIAAGQTLRADVADPDGLDKVYYLWETRDDAGNWTAVPGGASRELAIGATVPTSVRLLTSYADAYGAIEESLFVIGSEQADTLAGTTGNDIIAARAGNDTIQRSTGHDTIDGGAGLDTFVSPHMRYIVGQSSAVPGEWYIADIISGSADLANVERAHFRDVSVALDIDGAAGQAYRLYNAAFDRAPDEFGIGFWISRLDLGVSLEDIAGAFVASPEFKTLYGDAPSNAEIVNKFYENVLDRRPDPVGTQFWIDVLDRKAATVAEVLIGFSESDENAAALVGTLAHGIAYLPYA